MDKIRERDLKLARRIALESGSDLLHALGCLECNLREDFLFILGVLGWDEESFMGDYFAWLRRAR